jgi:uncharacterized coiled-coil protein SlyX
MDYFALAKDLGWPAALAIVALFGLERAGFFRWLFRMHRAVAQQGIKEHELLAVDRRDLIGWLRTEIQDQRTQLASERIECTNRLNALELRHSDCERQLTELRGVIGERDRVRDRLAERIILLQRYIAGEIRELPPPDALAALLTSDIEP